MLSAMAAIYPRCFSAIFSLPFQLIEVIQTSISRQNKWSVSAIHSGRDVAAVLPTGYGKSMIFHLIPAIFQDCDKISGGSWSSPQVRPVVIVVSPLNALIKDQIRWISQGTLTAAALNVKRNQSNSGYLDLEVGDANFSQWQDAEYNIVFTHPEAFQSCKQGMNLFRRSPYQCAVTAVVVGWSSLYLGMVSFKFAI